jgi:Asp-tRNA(Asn)/Glu-tRNA(Gln) amidotransferase A subunit family amidase
VAAAKKPGWLTGIPLCIKDLENAKGLPTALGGCRLVGKQMQASQSTDNIKDSYIFDNKWVFANAQEDDPYVERLRDAGGKHCNFIDVSNFCLSLDTHYIICPPYCSAIIIGKTNSKCSSVLMFFFSCPMNMFSNNNSS